MGEDKLDFPQSSSLIFYSYILSSFDLLRFDFSENSLFFRFFSFSIDKLEALLKFKFYLDISSGDFLKLTVKEEFPKLSRLF